MAQGRGRQPYPIGYRRKGQPEMMGWAELVRVSERTDTTVREMRDVFPDEFPRPIVVLSVGPVYLAKEVRAFFDKHPRRAIVTEETIRSIQSMISTRTARDTIARILDVSISTVNKYASEPRI